MKDKTPMKVCVMEVRCSVPRPPLLESPPTNASPSCSSHLQNSHTPPSYSRYNNFLSFPHLNIAVPIDDCSSGTIPHFLFRRFCEASHLLSCLGSRLSMKLRTKQTTHDANYLGSKLSAKENIHEACCLRSRLSTKLPTRKAGYEASYVVSKLSNKKTIH
jgi:hypothetical protein